MSRDGAYLNSILESLSDDTRTMLDKMFMRGEPVVELGGHEYRFIFESDLDWTVRSLGLKTLWACEIDGTEYRLCGQER
jgi:hypothetical protein